MVEGELDDTGEQSARGLVRLILAQSVGYLVVLLIILIASITLSSRIETSLQDQADLSTFAQSIRDVATHREAIGASVFRTETDPRMANTNLVRLKQDVSHVVEETSTWPEQSALIHDPAVRKQLARASLVINDFAQFGLQLVGNPQQLADRTTEAKFAASYDNAGFVLGSVLDGIDAQQISAKENFVTNSDVIRASIIIVLVFLAIAGVIVGLVALARARHLARRLTRTLTGLETETRNRRIDADLRDGLDLVNSENQLIGTVQSWLPLAFPDSRAELFLMDSSRAHLNLVAHNGDDLGACSIEAPESCPAIRKAMVLEMPISAAPTACPYLRERGEGFSATCAPISFGAQPFGVVHVVARTAIPEAYDRTVTTASIIGARLGAMRAFGTAQRQATTDSLTGLLNRRATESELMRVHETGTPFVFAMLDIDHFKNLNDVHGHPVGDAALRTFANAVRMTMRESDIAGRFGGEEFVLVFTDSSEAQALSAIERLRAELQAVCAVSGVPTFTFSAGVATSASRTTVDEILKLADQRLLAAKAAGRNRTIGSAGDHCST